ncbi:Tlg2-vesicle protein [Spiromyces aspiralis]|uniref:Tlg2-vesicle protein n=1 Tax=Spiromyces aspiralis TaxID=68401 RepID=A0ACC1HRI6_9FUNG|nr:Tlg2-vesicle protein [Spiromyces aspiralis]
MVGYSLVITVSGFAFGFPLGFLPVFAGASIGSLLCFYVGRRWGSRYVRYVMNLNSFMAECVKVVETGGFKLLLLVRLSPYPFNIVNLLLSATHISFRKYAAATLLSLLKLLLHVYIGANLEAITDLFRKDKDGDDGDSEKHNTISKQKLIFMIVGIVISVATMVYIMVVAKRRVEEAASMMRRQEEGEEEAIEMV